MVVGGCRHVVPRDECILGAGLTGQLVSGGLSVDLYTEAVAIDCCKVSGMAGQSF
jgi:hypothetical protein